MDLGDLLRLLAPLIIGFGVAAICPIRSRAGSGIPARPPAWVFFVVWPILYILIGICWAYAARWSKWYDLGFLALVIILASWVATYGCGRNVRGALYILVVSLLVVTMLVVSLTGLGTQLALLLVPLLIWLVFAYGLNLAEVNKP